MGPGRDVFMNRATDSHMVIIVISYVYGSIFITDVASEEIKTKMYLYVIMAVRRANFEKRAVEIRLVSR